MARLTRPHLLDERARDQICSRLSANKRVRRALPVWGRVHIDRQLPFLCVYRRPVGREDAGTSDLVTSEASYLIGAGNRSVQENLSSLVEKIARTLTTTYGSCLVLEIWSGRHVEQELPVTVSSLEPGFKIVVRKGTDVTGFVDRFHEILSRVEISRNHSRVDVTPLVRVAPPKMTPLLSSDQISEIGCHLFGLEVAPVHQDPVSGELFTTIFRELRQRLTTSLRRVFFDYARTQTTHRPVHYHSLGRRGTVKAVWEADRVVAEVSAGFDFLLQLTPVNTAEAWNKFRRSRYERTPRFHYRPLRVEPMALKRKLYRAPVERIEDPALGLIFQEKVDELDRQITLLKDRNTPRFILGSEQLYGDVDESLEGLALQVLTRTRARSRGDSLGDALDAEAFASRAREEIEYYRALYPELDAKVEVRQDISTLMVSRGSLLISSGTRIPASRVEALLQHEIGTHVLTYHNGKAQRLRMLSYGFAGYDALQEGLAVLSEYLVGGLSISRLRLLAARVLAARSMLTGANFVDVFRLLSREYSFEGHVAFNVAMRTFRGGGLTKDAVYLQGLDQILRYLAKGGDLDPLYVGKIGTDHIPIIHELRWRKVLAKPPLKPRYLNDPRVGERLELLKKGMTVMDLIKEGRSMR